MDFCLSFVDVAVALLIPNSHCFALRPVLHFGSLLLALYALLHICQV